MIVTCNECDASFNVDDSLIKEDGSKVRCSKCRSVFVVYPEAFGSEPDEDDDLLALDMDDGLDEDLDADEELADLAMDDDADDELPDLEDMMDFADDDLPVEESDEEESAGLDLDLDLETEEADTGVADSALEEDQGLDLDFDLEADEADSGMASSVLEEDEGLDLDFDLDEESMTESDESEADTIETADTDLPDLEMDMADLDEAEEVDTAEAESDLDLDMAADEELAVSAAEGADELDLSDLEDLVASDADLDFEGVAAETDEDADLDFDLESDQQDEAVAVGEGADELDLSDLEDIMDSGEVQAGEEIADQAAEDLDLDFEAEPAAAAPAGETEGPDELDFSDLDDIVESGEAQAAAEDDLVLDFEVDEDGSGPVVQTDSQALEELEMSDLEKMLEPDEKPVSSEENELDIGLELEGEPTAGAGEPTAVQAESEEAEFLDIEKMLEESAEAAPADQGAEDLVELDLEAVLDEAETSRSEEPELELNLDLDADSPLDASASAEDDLEFKLLDSDEETMQFGATQAAATLIESEPEASSELRSSTDDFATDEFADTGDVMGQTDTLDSMSATMGAPMKMRKTRKPVMAVVLILLLAIVGIIVTNNLGIKIPYVSDVKIPYISDVKIPYLSGLLKSEDKDLAGNLKISPLDGTISYKFIENATIGRIFVISGQVRNEYDHPRSNIKITGKIYRKGKALVKSSTVYCGNMLTDADLEQMDIAAIGKRLQNRFGDNRSNIKVKTGMTIPFIIVFNKLPANLDEYTVEVAGSSS